MITDQHKRPLHDLRISVTDRCNFRCQYCMPKEIFGPDYPFLPKDAVLSFEEIERVARIFTELGVKKLRITGGEPLIRKGLPELIQRLVEMDGIKDMGLTTNGVLLSKQAEALYAAGLRRLNISLDALNDDIFTVINGSGVSSKTVLAGIEKAVETGFLIKVNMVVQKGVNEHEIIPMADFFREKGITLRFIEFMDVGNSNGWNMEKVITKKEMYKMLSDHFELEPVDAAYFGEVAKRYRYKNTSSEIGFITSVSESFCSSCTRARISADGRLYTCLFAGSGYDLRKLLRSGASDEEIQSEIIALWNNRYDRYSDERTQNKAMKKKIEMSYIGG
ncbi:GTP 3',8-cyclase MoaA [Bacillus sp. FJAT-49736]|uniref:GTP 3',8-cyclase MoaA n=1 Tax=Bacillus sp. FJAT-49736 TaxID=2833582 RepID=UPI0024B5D606|nr:GTP 3',8-cyclase MoaA [Bacillus sp. FJAT-49736]